MSGDPATSVGGVRGEPNYQRNGQMKMMKHRTIFDSKKFYIFFLIMNTFKIKFEKTPDLLQ